MLKLRWPGRRSADRSSPQGSMRDHPDLRIGNLLDDPQLRHAMGLDEPQPEARPAVAFEHGRQHDATS